MGRFLLPAVRYIIPFVSAKEQSDIESLYSSPDNYDESEFEDLTDC
jgi:hypothetical protein